MNPVKALEHAEAMRRNAELCADVWGRVFGDNPRDAMRAATHLHEWASLAHEVLEPTLTETQLRDAWAKVCALIARNARHVGGIKMMAVIIECGAAYLLDETLRRVAGPGENN